MKLQLTPGQIDRILKIIGKDVEVLLFGSRATGAAREFSDIDLCLKSTRPISLAELSAWKEKFQNSNIPYKVDLVSYEDLSEDFRQLISKTAIPLLKMPAATGPG